MQHDVQFIGKPCGGAVLLALVRAWLWYRRNSCRFKDKEDMGRISSFGELVGDEGPELVRRKERRDRGRTMLRYKHMTEDARAWAKTKIAGRKMMGWRAVCLSFRLSFHLSFHLSFNLSCILGQWKERIVRVASVIQFFTTCRAHTNPFFTSSFCLVMLNLRSG